MLYARSAGTRHKRERPRAKGERDEKIMLRCQSRARTAAGFGQRLVNGSSSSESGRIWLKRDVISIGAICEGFREPSGPESCGAAVFALGAAGNGHPHRAGRYGVAKKLSRKVRQLRKLRPAMPGNSAV